MFSTNELSFSVSRDPGQQQVTGWFRIQSTDEVKTGPISQVIYGEMQRPEVVNGSQLYFSVSSPCSKRIQPSL
jgi:hypothetical protein